MVCLWHSLHGGLLLYLYKESSQNWRLLWDSVKEDWMLARNYRYCNLLAEGLDKLRYRPHRSDLEIMNYARETSTESVQHWTTFKDDLTHTPPTRDAYVNYPYFTVIETRWQWPERNAFNSYCLFSEHNPTLRRNWSMTAYQLLVSVLSAQCTDKGSIDHARDLRRYPDAKSLSTTASTSYFFRESISYPNNKTKHLLLWQKCWREFHGECRWRRRAGRIAGVGRKTANVITSVVDNQPNMAVDTHVFRVSAHCLTVNAKHPWRLKSNCWIHPRT